MGGDSWFGRMCFKFWDGHASGWMAFTGPASSRLLLVTDAGYDVVHVIDVVRRVRVGHVAAPGAIPGPRGAAATGRGSLVAVGSWRLKESGGGDSDHVVRLFEGGGTSWTATRVLAGGFGAPGDADGQLSFPHGLRFTSDGKELAVADRDNDCVSVFRVEDGSLARHLYAEGRTGYDSGSPYDLEECEGGWLVAHEQGDSVRFLADSEDSSDSESASDDGATPGPGSRVRTPSRTEPQHLTSVMSPIGLALIPGVGLVVREQHDFGRLEVFASADWDFIAMASMSACRVVWMGAVGRAVALRLRVGVSESGTGPGIRVPKRKKGSESESGCSIM